MAGISPEALAGYILEEVLAYLLRRAGYRLLTDAAQDPHELANRHHGLVVRGRGGEHQVDVLGELLWIPAFTFPLRLVLEAKCRKGKTEIGTVRNMVAALMDINQNNRPHPTVSGGPLALRPKYSYVGAIFSASGFSSHAADFALAHAVSLVDLRTPEFHPLVVSAHQCGATLNRNYRRQEKRSAAGFVRAVRDSLRTVLQTSTPAQAHLIQEAETVPHEYLAAAVDAATHAEELFIGMASGPYMLVLKADSPRRFLQFSIERPTHSIEIHWSRSHDKGQTWNIHPVDNPDAYRLSFKLPERLAKWIFESENVRRAASMVKEDFLSSITIYRKEMRRDQLIRLEYNPSNITQRST